MQSRQAAGGHHAVTFTCSSVTLTLSLLNTRSLSQLHRINCPSDTITEEHRDTIHLTVFNPVFILLRVSTICGSPGPKHTELCYPGICLI